MGSIVFVQVIDGVVVNRTVATSDWPHDASWIANDTAQIGWTYDGSQFHPPAPPTPGPVTTDQVNAERDRRIFPGPITIQGPGVDPVAVDMRIQTDRDNLTSLAVGAGIYSGLGVTDPIIAFTDANNVTHQYTPQQMQIIAAGSLQYGSMVYAAARILKTMSPIPVNYADNNYWPSTNITVTL